MENVVIAAGKGLRLVAMVARLKMFRFSSLELQCLTR